MNTLLVLLAIPATMAGVIGIPTSMFFNYLLGLPLHTTLLGQLEALDFDALMSLVDAGLAASGAGAWVALSVVVIQALILVAKAIKASWMRKYGTLAITVASAIAAVLASVAGGLGWKGALVVFVANLGSKFIHDLIRGIKRLRGSKDAEPKDEVK